MKFSVLCSSSAGNATYLETSATRILIDAGWNCRNLKGCLEEIGAAPESIDAICITHDHVDHVSALAVIEKKRPIPIYAADGTIEAIAADYAAKGAEDWPWMPFSPGCPFEVGDVRIHPFAVPHDCAEPVGYTVEADGKRLGFATDLGEAPVLVRRRLMDCDALVLEFNHDLQMLRNSGRPMSLIQRIHGRSGHLSNEQAGEVLREVASPRLRHIVPAHLSGECNTPGLVREEIRKALEGTGFAPAIHLPPYPLAPIEL